MQWTEEDIENAQQKVEENSSIKIPLHEQSNWCLPVNIPLVIHSKYSSQCHNFHHTGKFDIQACDYWDKFYTMHQDRFFKDRRWLFIEFPELLPSGAEFQATNMRLPSGSSTGTEARQTQRPDNQHKGPTHHQKQTSSDQNSCQEAEDEHNLKTFPGQHASFKILEVFRSFHVYCSFGLI